MYSFDRFSPTAWKVKGHVQWLDMGDMTNITSRYLRTFSRIHNVYDDI